MIILLKLKVEKSQYNNRRRNRFVNAKAKTKTHPLPKSSNLTVLASRSASSWSFFSNSLDRLADSLLSELIPLPILWCQLPVTWLALSFSKVEDHSGLDTGRQISACQGSQQPVPCAVRSGLTTGMLSLLCHLIQEKNQPAMLDTQKEIHYASKLMFTSGTSSQTFWFSLNIACYNVWNCQKSMQSIWPARSISNRMSLINRQ